MTKDYQEFLKLIKEIYSLQSSQSLLGWDQETMMPPKGGEGRASSLALLSRLIQEKYCSEKLGGLIEKLVEEKSLSDEERVNVREIKRDRDKLLKVPPELTEEIARTTSLAQQTWTKARPKSDTELFNPWLKQVFDLHRQLAECLGYQESAYDALLDQYEPGALASEISRILMGLKENFLPLLQKITHSSAVPRKDILKQPFPIPEQRRLSSMVLKDMTFNSEAGRLDESAHPFTEGMWPGDVRLTTRYAEKDVLSSLFGTIHEGGHGLYEQGFLPKHYGTPMAEAVSLGIHESQSRLWENLIGRGKPFWRYYYPKFKKIFPEQVKSTSLSEFYLAVNYVEPSLIRVEADEVTYNLHIILRFEIEKALFDGEIKVHEIEAVWNEKMKHLLGIVPETARDGYLQDVHWSAGLIGYFPTYSLGNIYSAQLYHKLKLDLPELEENIERGDFHSLKEWLRDHIYSHGRRFCPAKLMELATGEPPGEMRFIDYLTDKYTDLYKL
jgi:carboxypeptidase Taq